MYKKDSVLTGTAFAKSDLESIFIQINIFLCYSFQDIKGLSEQYFYVLIKIVCSKVK